MPRGNKLLSLQLVVLAAAATVLLGLISAGGTVDGLAKRTADPPLVSADDVDAGASEYAACSQAACPAPW